MSQISNTSSSGFWWIIRFPWIPAPVRSLERTSLYVDTQRSLAAAIIKRLTGKICDALGIDWRRIEEEGDWSDNVEESQLPAYCFHKNHSKQRFFSKFNSACITSPKISQPTLPMPPLCFFFPACFCTRPRIASKGEGPVGPAWPCCLSVVDASLASGYRECHAPPSFAQPFCPLGPIFAFQWSPKEGIIRSASKHVETNDSCSIRTLIFMVPYSFADSLAAGLYLPRHCQAEAMYQLENTVSNPR